MAAVSCLRVMVDADRTDLPLERLGPLVSKYTNIFFEVRWVRPRTAAQLTHYTYLLGDPHSDVLDTVELARLATELQERLFGTGVEDAVKLVLFEGEPDAIEAFAAASAEDVALAMEDPGRLPKGGRLRRIAADGSLVDVPEEARSDDVPTDDLILGPSVDGAQGIYMPKGAAFVGDVISCTPARAKTWYSLVDGDEHLPMDSESFDGGCVMTALRFLLDFDITAPLHVPVSFSTLVRPTQRAHYVELLGILPAEARARLSATVYDVPRAPSFQSIKIIHDTLRGHFAGLDLRTSDPDFEIRQLAGSMVTSVSLILPSATSEVRVSALRRFASHAGEYRRRRMRWGLTNIRTGPELDLAIRLGLPFLSGPAVCRMLESPIGGRRWAAEDLPMVNSDPVFFEIT